MLKSVASILISKLHQYSERLWARYDSFWIYKDHKVLFIDLGANLGQGFTWFKRYFHQPNIFFELFEPNPFCFQELMKLSDVISENIQVHNLGVGVSDGSFKSYGLTDSEGGKFAEGGSFVQEHNSKWYESVHSEAIDLKVINFGEYVTQKKRVFDKVIVKMDIEGAELVLLEHMIANNEIQHIDLLYIEFHSQYQKPDQSKDTRKREQDLKTALSKIPKIKIRFWH